MYFKKLLTFLMLLLAIAVKAQDNISVCPDYRFLCKGGLDIKGIGYPNNSANYCYEWQPAILLDNPNAPNPKIKVALNEKQTFTVKVITDEGIFIEDKITVLVYAIDLEIYQPNIDGGAMIADANEETIGAQTFVNIDNDDKDVLPDLNDDIVQGGDNELMKMKGKVKFYPDALPAFTEDPQERGGAIANFSLELNTLTEANTIQLWKWNDKREKNTNNVITQKELIDAGQGEYFFERYIEGIRGNTATRGTTIQLGIANNNPEVLLNPTCGTDKVAVTIVEIKSITWLGMGNGALKDTSGTKSDDFTGDFLDRDTVYGSINSVRVFPDGRIEGGVVSTSKNKVRIKVEVRPRLVYDAKIYLKAFDMDDPSQNASIPQSDTINRPKGVNSGRLIIDPNDDDITGTYEGGVALIYDKHNDNRGLVNSRKVGDAKGMNAKGVWQFTMPKNDSIKVGSSIFDTLLFKVSEYAGDNYALFASNDPIFLDSLENYDAKDIDKIMYINGLVRTLPIIKGVQSDILTVWRLLHIESDKMKPFEQKDNEARVYFTDFESPLSSTKQISKLKNMPDLRKLKVCECGSIKETIDYSKNLETVPINKSLGRFEGGRSSKVIVGVSDDYLNLNGAISNEDIFGNGNNFLSFIPGLELDLSNLPISLHNNNKIYQTKLIEGIKIDSSKYEWKLNFIDTINDLTNLKGGKLSFGNSLQKFVIDSINTSSSIAKFYTSNFKIILILRDDDELAVSQSNKNNADFSLLESSFKKAYIKPIIDGAGSFSNNTDTVEVLINIPKQNTNDILCYEYLYNTYCNSKAYEKDNFWCSYLIRMWQDSFSEDNDSNNELTLKGVTLIGPELTSSTSVSSGKNVVIIFREAIIDYNHNLIVKNKERGTIAHELGHTFGLSHGNDNIYNCNANSMFGLMGAGDVNTKIPYQNSSNSSDFVPLHINLMRSRKSSPGNK